MVAGLLVNGCWVVSQWLLGCYSHQVAGLLPSFNPVAWMLVKSKLLGC